VLAYAARHVDAHAAHGVVSEVFLTAWHKTRTGQPVKRSLVAYDH